MRKKYRLLKEGSKMVDGETVYRIQACRDFSGVQVDDIGGFVASESNLSHLGDCWIYNDAVVKDDALVRGDAIVLDIALIKDRASIIGEAVVGNDTVISGDTILDGVTEHNTTVDGVTVVDTKACILCCLKHLSQAYINMQETILGYPQYKWLVVGHLAEFEREIMGQDLSIAEQVRLARLVIMDSDELSIDMLQYDYFTNLLLELNNA